MATIKELIPLSTDILSGEAITNAQAKFLANTSAAGTIAGVTGGECVTADSSGNVTGFNNVGVGAKLTSVNIDFSGTITGTGSASITGVTFDTITLDGPTIDTSISGSAIDGDLTTGGTTTTIPHGSAVIAYVASEITAVTDLSPLVPTDDTKFPTSKAVADYVSSGLLTYTKVTAAWYTYNAGRNWTYAHGQGSVPDIVQGHAVKNATGGTDGGYSNGDKLILAPLISGSNSNDVGLTVWASSTVLGAVVGDAGNLKAHQKTTGNVFTLASGEWYIYIVGIWF